MNKEKGCGIIPVVISVSERCSGLKETLIRIKNSAGLALRIIFSVALMAVIIWKYRDLQNIDVRVLLAGISSFPVKILVLMGVYAVKGLTLVVPASLIYIATGMSISPVWLAIILNMVGIAIEVSITYLMGLILGGPYVTKKLKKTKYGEKLLEINEKHGKAGVFITRIAFMPIDFCSLFFGSMRVRYVPYLLMSLGGILPRVVLFTILGDKVYDLIPMRVIVPVAVALIAVILVIWIVRYAMTNAKKEAQYGKPDYTPISELKRNVIFDTDMGPDCDDAGALAILFGYLKKYDVDLLGVCNCTSNAYGNGAIRAICNFFGLEEPVMGRYSGKPVLPDSFKYNRPVTQKYFKYESSACAALNDTEFYEKLLSEAPDNSVTIISTGTFSSLSNAINANPALFNKKVHSVVSMAGKFPKGNEFNIATDPISAANFISKFKRIMVFSGFEVGEKIITGFEKPYLNNPIYDSYRLCTEKEIPLRESWDLTAVQYAFEGNGNFYALSKPVDITVDPNGITEAKKNKFSNRYHIILKAESSAVEEYLNEMLRSSGNTKTEAVLMQTEAE